MLNNIFLHIVNMGSQAVICILVVMAARWVLSMLHFPKRYLCYLCENLNYITFRGSVTTPVMAEAATTSGDAKMVRAPGP